MEKNQKTNKSMALDELKKRKGGTHWAKLIAEEKASNGVAHTVPRGVGR